MKRIFYEVLESWLGITVFLLAMAVYGLPLWIVLYFIFRR